MQVILWDGLGDSCAATGPLQVRAACAILHRMDYPWGSFAEQFKSEVDPADESVLPSLLVSTIQEAAAKLYEVLRAPPAALAYCPEYLRERPEGVSGCDQEGPPIEVLNWGAYWLLALQWLSSRGDTGIPELDLGRVGFIFFGFHGSWDEEQISFDRFCGKGPESRAETRRKIASMSVGACRYIESVLAEGRLKGRIPAEKPPQLTECLEYLIELLKQAARILHLAYVSGGSSTSSTDYQPLAKDLRIGSTYIVELEDQLPSDLQKDLLEEKWPETLLGAATFVEKGCPGLCVGDGPDWAPKMRRVHDRLYVFLQRIEMGTKHEKSDSQSSAIPPLDTSSEEWVRSKVAAKREGIETGTLAKYRRKPEARQIADDQMSGIDRDGRKWRRTGTPHAHPWYYTPSLKSRPKKN